VQIQRLWEPPDVIRELSETVGHSFGWILAPYRTAGVRESAATGGANTSRGHCKPSVEKKVTEFLEFPGTIPALEFVEIWARVEGWLESVDFEPWN
jgi:hypothetical protein